MRSLICRLRFETKLNLGIIAMVLGMICIANIVEKSGTT